MIVHRRILWLSVAGAMALYDEDGNVIGVEQKGPEQIWHPHSLNTQALIDRWERDANQRPEKDPAHAR